MTVSLGFARCQSLTFHGDVAFCCGTVVLNEIPQFHRLTRSFGES